ncbi:hypothetical protein U9M48_007298 [Paspalum notatum var. saurae]|uniref:Uncharacterized protein n=1 Tax=Paspalum notatum var. saurae TaxID=547442 RepID=A0AAQ3SL21_PASNO
MSNGDLQRPPMHSGIIRRDNNASTGRGHPPLPRAPCLPSRNPRACLPRSASHYRTLRFLRRARSAAAAAAATPRPRPPPIRPAAAAAAVSARTGAAAAVSARAARPPRTRPSLRDSPRPASPRRRRLRARRPASPDPPKPPRLRAPRPPPPPSPRADLRLEQLVGNNNLCIRHPAAGVIHHDGTRCSRSGALIWTTPRMCTLIRTKSTKTIDPYRIQEAIRSADAAPCRSAGTYLIFLVKARGLLESRADVGFPSHGITHIGLQASATMT